jgi:ABC-type polysaccharide/polyol phosphate export permease
LEKDMTGSALGDLTDGARNWRIWWLLAVQDVRLRYRRSLIGPLWDALAMFAIVMTLSWLYSAVIRVPIADYVGHFALGLFVWQFINGSVHDASGSVIDNAGLLTTVRPSMSVIAGRICARNTLISLHQSLAIIAAFAIFSLKLTPTALLAIVGFVLLLLFGYFLVALLGPICARFRDIQQMIATGMQAMFFLTPIIWMPQRANINRTIILDWNPFYYMLELVRAPLLGHVPPVRYYVVVCCIVLGMAIAAYASTALTRRKLALWL